MTDKTKVYTVVVTYNGEKWIRKCLATIYSSTIKTGVIIVDNNSNDDTLNIVEKEFPEVILLKQPKNLGFGAANNLGICHALKNSADFVFLLNQDAYLQPDTLKKLIDVSNNNHEFAIISPIHLNGNASKVDKKFSNYIKINDVLFYDAIKGDFSKPIYHIPFINAAAWLLPRKTLETIGGFDPIFYHYAEDDNYCQRVLYHGLKIGVVPNCYIQHDRESRPANTEINHYNLILRERQLKCKWANINVEVFEEIDNQKKYLKTLLFKLFIKFKFKKLHYYKNELALINRIAPEIFKSRNINLKQGRHYLNNE